MFMVRLQDPRREADRRSSTWPWTTSAGDARQRHAAPHHPAEHPVPRRPEDEPEGRRIGGINDGPDHDARGVRRREPQRHGLPGPARRPAARRGASDWPTPSPPTWPRGRARTTRSGSTARSSVRTPARPTASSRSTARSTCRGSSRPAFGLPDDNCVDVYAKDLGFLAAIENGQRGRLQRARRRRHGHDARQREHLPAPGPADLLRRAGRGGGGGRGGRQALPRPRQPRRPQAGPAQVRRSTTGASRSSARCSPATTGASRSACRANCRSPASTCTTAGTRRATASGSSA